MKPGRPRFSWLVLQEGSLPLRPVVTEYSMAPHACTSVLLWPEKEKPGSPPTIITDPCLTEQGYRNATLKLDKLGSSLRDIGLHFSTHEAHWDHALSIPGPTGGLDWTALEPGKGRIPPGIQLVHLPGHEADLHALTFQAGEGKIWIVGDAVLDEEWLLAWGYYWPNQYTEAEILQTWRSVARILAEADVVIPGHGTAVPVTPDLLAALARAFPDARCASKCPDVLETINKRLAGERK